MWNSEDNTKYNAMQSCKLLNWRQWQPTKQEGKQAFWKTAEIFLITAFSAKAKNLLEGINLAHHSAPKDGNHLLTSSPKPLNSFSSNNTYQAWLSVTVLGVFHLVVVPGTRFQLSWVELKMRHQQTACHRLTTPSQVSNLPFLELGKHCFNDEVQTLPSPPCHPLFVLCCIQMTSQDFFGPCYCNDPTHIDVVLNCNGKGQSTVEQSWVGASGKEA